MHLEIFGYLGAILVGLTLGLMGGGGSILTVPILVYLFSIDAVQATADSLFIVGFTSLIGSISHMKMGNIHWRTAVIFGIPSIISIFLTRAFLMPAIPDSLFHIGNFEVTKSVGLLLLFAIVMLMASYSMIRKQQNQYNPSGQIQYNFPMIVAEGILVGAMTGLVGAGGGFLIIPGLVLLAKLPMKKAVGTSLIIIAVNSFIGFMGDIKNENFIDWKFLLLFTGIAIIGILSGSILSKKIPGEKLKPAFGWFILVMGIYIILRETILH
ncbi:MAG: sulfite exporter TauE/SafE family protein [Chitinophagales bacterium]